MLDPYGIHAGIVASVANNRCSLPSDRINHTSGLGLGMRKLLRTAAIHSSSGLQDSPP